jgi:hypothetical protein
VREFNEGEVIFYCWHIKLRITPKEGY